MEKNNVISGDFEDFSSCCPTYPVDLHTHTTRSDGSDTPQELIDHASALGIKVLAITDHDIRPPEKIRINPVEGSLTGAAGAEPSMMDAVDYAWSRGLRLIRGIEISCETTVEDCHIVCLGCDWKDPFFGELERSVVESKICSYRELVERLDADGMKMTWQEVLENGGKPVREDQVQKKMIFELIA